MNEIRVSILGLVTPGFAGRSRTTFHVAAYVSILCSNLASAVEIHVDGSIEGMNGYARSFPEIEVGDAVRFVFSLPENDTLMGVTRPNTRTVQTWTASDGSGSFSGQILHGDTHQHVLLGGHNVTVTVFDNWAVSGTRVDKLIITSTGGSLEIHDDREHNSQLLDIVGLGQMRIQIDQDRDWLQGTTLEDIPTSEVLSGRFDLSDGGGSGPFLSGQATSVHLRMSQLLAGDADQDLDFDQFDLVQVIESSKYATGSPATWGEGDWNGAPGGSQGNPPIGDGIFDQYDIMAALATGTYLTGSYAALEPYGRYADNQTSIVYDANSGELSVNAPTGIELTSVSVESASGVFSAEAAQNLSGSFDIDTDESIFKATFGGSFGSLSFGNVAQPGLSEEFVLSDLAAVGSLAGGGTLGEVDLIYVPAPSTIVLSLVAVTTVCGLLRKLRRMSPNTH